MQDAVVTCARPPSRAARPDPAAAPQRPAEAGFTLVELLVVILIIGILAAIAIPLFLKQRQKAYDAQAKSDLRNVATLEEAYYVDHSSYANLAVDGVEPASPATNTLYYNRSPRTSLVSIEYVGPDGTLNGAISSSGYCLLTRSDSGKTFSYLSTQGVLVLGDVCP